MRKIVTIFFLSMLSAGSFAQWEQQNSGTTKSLYSLYFTSADTGYAAGNEIILKTNNGGANWTTIASISGKVIRSMYFVNDTLGYAAGDAGYIIKTTNAGVSWNTQTSGVTANLWSVYFVSPDTGYVVGDAGTVIKTNDGGFNWYTAATLATGLKSTFFTSFSTGYAVGNTGSVYKTTNGGQNWTTQNSGVTNNLNSVYFVSGTTGYVVGATGTILKTTNSGSTWTFQYGGGSLNLNSVYFPTADVGYAVAGNGSIVSTTCGGSSWVSQYSTTTNDLFSDFFTGPSVGYAVGYNGMIIKTVYGIPEWHKYAYNDSILSFMNIPVVVHVLGNDELDAPLNAINYIANPEVCDYPYIYGPLVSEQGGTLDIMNADSITYSPSTGFVGWDNFYYGICNNGSTYETDTAKVYVYVVPSSFLNLDQINGGINDTLYVSSYPATIDAGFGWQTYEWSNGSTAQTTQVTANGWYSATVSLSSKLTSVDSIYVLLTTYGQINDAGRNVAVYPNPAGSEVTVEINENAMLEVVNVRGQVLSTKPLVEKANSVDVSGLSSGVYALRIRTDSRVIIRKLIKK